MAFFSHDSALFTQILWINDANFQQQKAR